MVVLLTLLVLTPILKLLPYNCMAAIIIVGLTSLFELGVAWHLLRVHLRDFFVFMAAFLCTLFLGIELGLALSIGLAVLIVIFESAFPHTAVLGRVERSQVYRNIEQYPDAELVPGILIVRLDAPVYFANVQWCQDKLVEYERAAERFAVANGAPRLEYVVLDLTPVPHLDSMGGDFIVQLAEDYAARGIRLVLSNPNTRVLRMLDRCGATLLPGETPEDAAANKRGNRVPREWVFVRVHDAVNACLFDMSHADGGEGGRGLPSAGGDGAGCSADLAGQRAIARVSAAGVLLGFEPVAGAGAGGSSGGGAGASGGGVDKPL
jgi:sulfate transporter 4